MRSGGPEGKLILKGRAIYEGRTEGESLVSALPMSFLGGVDPRSGKVVEHGSDILGRSLKGKVLVFPTGKGSTVGSYVLYRLTKDGIGPSAIINSKCETIVAVGAIISEIPCVDLIDISRIKTGSKLTVKGDTVEVEDDENPRVG
jgi:predicted aconitase with swiveling domain